MYSEGNLAPVVIETMLLIYSRADPELRSAPAVSEALSCLRDNGLICDTGASAAPRWEATEKGKAWIKMIEQLPFPRQAWIDNKGEVIK